MADSPIIRLTDDEKQGIRTAVESTFLKLRNLYNDIRPTFERYGFTPPSAGVVARDLSEKIEVAIVQHCPTFAKGVGHADLQRQGQRWEVKICRDSGLTINQNVTISGENYIVVNYKANTQVVRIWILWQAQDAFFSQRKANSNARSALLTAASAYIEELYRTQPGVRQKNVDPMLPYGPKAKAV